MVGNLQQEFSLEELRDSAVAGSNVQMMLFPDDVEPAPLYPDPIDHPELAPGSEQIVQADVAEGQGTDAQRSLPGVQRADFITMWVLMLAGALVKKGIAQTQRRYAGLSGRRLRRAMGDYRTLRQIQADEAIKAREQQSLRAGPALGI